jgi:hypothetical protein
MKVWLQPWRVRECLQEEDFEKSVQDARCSGALLGCANNAAKTMKKTQRITGLEILYQHYHI